MEKKSQVKIIKEAFSADIPEDKSLWPEYYKQRMDICAVCDKNTANIAKGGGTIGKIAKFSAKKIGAQCSVCGCVIDRKCWSKNEECGLGEIPGMFPKWNRMLMETSKSDMFDVENLSYNNCNLRLSEDGGEFIFDLGDIYSEDPAEVAFKIITRKPMKYDNLEICSCMHPEFMSYDDQHFEIKVHLNTPIGVGDYNRRFFVDFRDPSQVGEDGELKPYVLIMVIVANVKSRNNSSDGGSQST